MSYEKETIIKKWKLIQLITKKGSDENDDSAFLQAHIRSRSIQKVAKTLPKSPRKHKEFISALANKFKLRIKPTQSKPGRPKNELTESKKKNGSKTFLIHPILHMSPHVEKIIVMSGKLMVKASMSRISILCGHSMIY